MNMQAYVADEIFTGSEWLTRHAILVADGEVQSIVMQQEIPPGTPVETHLNSFIAPAFIDLQIYGALGNLLAVKPTTETLTKTYEYCKAGGAAYFLPAVATNTYLVFYACIDAVREYWKEGKQGVLGLHIEGPWISREKRGAHIDELIHSPSLQEVESLLAYGKGVIKIITLAPEVCSAEVIALIRSYGVVISAGHSNATFEQATTAFNRGCVAATHLFNAMSSLQHRSPGMVGAIMQHDRVMSSIIPDGHHVDFAVVNIAKRLMNDRLFIITDAVTETDEGYYPHKMEDDKYVSNGTLSGSALTMAKAVKNCVEKAGIDPGEALRMASLYPAKVMGLDNDFGRIAKSYKASFVVMKDNFEVEKVISSDERIRSK
jgi:N-acetylglucosamine-6-phosphate deacetylase